jgi:hypothetical protein
VDVRGREQLVVSDRMAPVLRAAALTPAIVTESGGSTMAIPSCAPIR